MLAGVNFLSEGLNGDDIHRLTNLLTLSYSIHQAFDRLYLWFTPHPDGEPHKYMVNLHDSMSDVYELRDIPQVVHWHTPDASRFPLPDPRFLAVRATAARVAWMSGAAEYVQKVLDRDEEEFIPELAADGSTHEALNKRLREIAALA